MTTYVILFDDNTGFLASWNGKSLNLTTYAAVSLTDKDLTGMQVLRCRWHRTPSHQFISWSASMIWEAMHAAATNRR